MMISKFKNLLQVPSSPSKCLLVTVSVQQRQRGFSSDRPSVAERFSWLLAESHNSGVVDGLKKTYRLASKIKT